MDRLSVGQAGRGGERAYEALSKIVKNHAQHNLFLEAHGNPQVGDAQGIPAAVLEMLVQFDGEKYTASRPAQAVADRVGKRAQAHRRPGD